MKYRGYYTNSKVYGLLKQPEKYCGKVKKIVTRSRWELSFILRFLDCNSQVDKWASESIVVPYRSDIDGKVHRYFVDFYMRLKDGREYMIEVKPHDFIKPPKKPKRKTRKSLQNYQKLIEQYIKNTNKWDAAKRMCEQLKTKGHNIEFKLITEKEIYGQ